MDEQALARRCSEGDRMAEDELYRRYAARVYTLCRRYLANDEEAEDLMQDALIQALDKIQTYTYSGEGSLCGWIKRIAVNMALNRIKRRKMVVVSMAPWHKDNIPEPSEEEIDAIPQEKLLEWIAMLPGLRRTVFNLYCIDGYNHKEIAGMLGISEKGSAGVLAKARKQLKGFINQYLKEQGT
jgi:RNA polymerase sigma-70 factor (ECF subfamily)